MSSCLRKWTKKYSWKSRDFFLKHIAVTNCAVCSDKVEEKCYYVFSFVFEIWMQCNCCLIVNVLGVFSRVCRCSVCCAVMLFAMMVANSRSYEKKYYYFCLYPAFFVLSFFSFRKNSNCNWICSMPNDTMEVFCVLFW